MPAHIPHYRGVIFSRENGSRLTASSEAVRALAAGLLITDWGVSEGVGVGTLYRGIPDRAALLDELQRRGYDLLLATQAGIKADGPTGADAISPCSSAGCAPVVHGLAAASPAKGHRCAHRTDGHAAGTRCGGVRYTLRARRSASNPANLAGSSSAPPSARRAVP
jgi:hypothetical protein